MIGVEFDTAEHAEEVQWAGVPARPARPRVRQDERPDVAAADRVSEAEMATALRIFGEAVAAVAGDTARSSRRRRGRRDARGRGRRLNAAAPPMTTSKVASMRDAIADLVRDGDTVAIEGFTHLIGFAAGHEIIRQRRRDLTLARMTPDVIYDQMIAGRRRPQARLLVARQPGRRRARRDPAADRGRRSRSEPLEVEEYSHFGMVARYTAGAMNLPFFPLRSYFETDLPSRQPAHPRRSRRRTATRRSTPSRRCSPDVTIVHAQRAEAAGNTQVWGLLGCQKEAAFAADRVIVVVEELVDEAVIRADPNRTIIPGLIVDAVVVEPCGAHPSYVQGAYDRDNRFYLDWDPITRDEAAVQAWLREWVYDLDGRAAYVEKLGAERVASPASRAPRRPGSVDYGAYR